MPKYTKWSLLAILCLFTQFPLTAKSIAYWNGNSLSAVGADQLSNNLMNKADQFFKEENYQSALDHYFKFLESGVVNEDQKAKVWFKIARAYQKLNQYPDALEFYKRFLHLAPSTNQASEQARVWGYIASIHQHLGNFERSQNYQLKALRLNEASDDSLGIARSLYDLGTLYFYQEKFEEALIYYTQSEQICRSINNQKSLYSCQAALGSVQMHLGNLDLALDYNFQSLQVAREKKMKSGQAYVLNNIGFNYTKLEVYDSAQFYLNEAMKIWVRIGDKWGQTGTYANLGELFLDSGMYKEAIKNLTKGLELAREIDSKTREVDLFELLADAYFKAGYFPESHASFQQHIALKDSLVNKQIQQTMEFRKTDYEIQKRENKIQLLEKENELLEKDRVISYWYAKYFWSAIGISGLVFLLLFIIYRYQSQRKLTRRLKGMNDKIQFQNRQLEFNNHELKKFAYIASHDLKAPLRSIGSFTGLLRRKYSHLFDQTAFEYMNYIVDGSKRMYQLLDDLLAYSNIEKLAYGKEGVLTSLEEWLDTRSIVREAINNLSFRINEYQVDIKVNENALPKLKANHTHMTQLFQNIIDNGIKFKGDIPPKINIDCASDEKQHTFSIRDNGIGIAPEYQEKIFGMFSRLHGVNAYEGTGIGLATCKKIIEKHGGEIWVESEPGFGSTFYFSLPR